eukprot:NODE_7289_length_777_cov_90.629969_g7048_i0.p2 GENE.NODE_7289_length_777_cov_90.629969_g7048_i0~~NODE_7289_length_777_cov_90.629969_g7048_i0.p2  ORF type:complete len:209 (+),score=36.70 NODE_7289_length_777_cov_90.629969_g7048_i0:64-690(+)
MAVFGLDEVAIQISVALILSFLVFYSGYSKVERGLRPKQVFEIISFSNPKYSMAQLNKVVALSGMALFGTGMLLQPLNQAIGPLPWKLAINSQQRTDILLIALYLLLTHFAYSFAVIYGMNPMRALYDNSKWLAIVDGVVALSLFALMTWKGRLNEGWALLALTLGVHHFLIMEMSPTGKVQCRPYAWVAVMIPVVAIGLYVRSAGLF